MTEEFGNAMIFGGLMVAIMNGKSLLDWTNAVFPILKGINCGKLSLSEIESFCKEWNIPIDAIFILFDQYIESVEQEENNE